MKKPLPAEWPCISESVSEPGILYGWRGKFPDYEMERLGHKREFIIPRKKKHAVKSCEGDSK